MKYLIKGLYIFANGCIFFSISERFFWAFWRPAEDTTSAIFTGLFFYSILAYAFLYLAYSFSISDSRVLLIAATAYSFLAEGVLSGMLYSPMALLVIFVALPWHAIATIYFGWYLLPRWLSIFSLFKIITLCIGIGILWSYWAIGWFNLPGGDRYTVATFILHAFGTTGLLFFGYYLRGQLLKKESTQYYSSIEGWFLLSLGIAAVVFPLLFPAPLILSLPVSCALLAIFVLLFTRSRHITSSEQRCLTIESMPPIHRLTMIFIIPTTASGIMTIAFQNQWRFNSYFYVGCLIAGIFIILGYQSLRAIFFTAHQNTKISPTTFRQV